MSSPAIEINGTMIGNDYPCYVIAEVGANHMGDVGIAKDMIAAAKYAGADAVKLQKRDNRTLFTEAMYNSPYENENSFGPTYGEHREALELSLLGFEEMKHHANKTPITLFATPFDFPSVDFLMDLNMPAFKIASADVTNLPFLKYVAETGKPIFLSTGCATLDDVIKAHDTIIRINPSLCVMQCTSSYPAEAQHLNLKVVETYQKYFAGAVIGFSSHYNGYGMDLAARMLGACVVEKHFTLNRAWKGTDQAFSLEPDGLRRLTRDLKRIDQALGDGIKRPLDCEIGPMKKLRKGEGGKVELVS